MKLLLSLLTLSLLWLSSGPMALAQGDLRADVRGKLEARIRSINEKFNGELGVVFVDLTDGDRISFNAEMPFPTASTIKVAILIELFRQAESKPDLLKKRIPFSPNDRTVSSGMARLIGPASSLTVYDTAKLMINLSENTATNLLIDQVGMANVNKLTASLKLNTVQLQRKMLADIPAVEDRENVASPADAAELLTRIAHCNLPLKKGSCDQVRKIMEIPQPPHPAKDFIPSNIPIAFKWGGLEGVSAGWAIVSLPDRPYVFAIMTTYGVDNASAVRAVSEAGFDYFSRLARTNAYGARVPADTSK